MTAYAGGNCRANLAFVTDPANTAAVLGETYSHNYGTSWTAAGWDVLPPLLRDRDAGIDARLAGTNGRDGPTTGTFRVDVDAGTYDMELALGDASFASKVAYEVFDNASSLHSIALTDVAAGHFLDASDTDRTAAAWPGSNVKARYTISSGIFKINITGEAGVSRGVMAHLSLTSVTTGGFRYFYGDSPFYPG